MTASVFRSSDFDGIPPDWPGAPRYEFVRYIGRGGAGVVYEAWDRVRERNVALKTLANFSPNALYQFKQEFRTLADVRHAGLVRLYELVAPSAGRAFFTMELVGGSDFRTYTRRGSAPPARLERMVASTRPQLRYADVPSDHLVRRSSSPYCPSPIGRSPANAGRLRAAVVQLVRGVRALHAAGKLHRDIKPSNVLVTQHGRVVLVDFGIATELAVADFERGFAVGTPEYMAPEQASAGPPLPASDWYAVGAMLFDAMVGNPPFTGEPSDVIRLKTMMDPPRPSALVSAVPADLDELCAALLDRDPERRPTGDEILRALGVEPSVRPRPESPARYTASFVGRVEELKALERALSIAREGATVAVRVRGSSGQGKSALVQHFTDCLVRERRATVLRARAYEHESIPYKAVDGIIDSLSRHLKHREQQGEVIPVSRRLSALACLFPTLRRVQAVANLSENPRQDPLQIRQLAFAGLRELVSEVIAGEPAVLCIDDAQWGDVDSVGLLLGLVNGPVSPPTLMIFVHRDVPSETSPFLHELSQRWPKSVPLHDIEVGKLGPHELRQLVLQQLGPDVPSAESAADAISRESAGDPFLAMELACSARLAPSPRAQSSGRTAEISVEWLVEQRIADLDDGARRVLEIVALSGRPLKAEVVAAAANASDVLDQVIGALAQRRLIAAVQRDGQELIAPRHDRIREAIVARIPEVVSRAHHRLLAEAIEAMTAPDVEALVTHWLGAGDALRAGHAALAAAKQAADKLAFTRAEELYRLALANASSNAAETQDIRKQLAQVLEWDGRGVDAARVYLDASSCASGIERSELESAGAMQLLYSGRVREGAAVLRRSLAALGLRWPETLWSTLFWRIIYRAQLRFVAPRSVERRTSDVSDMARARVEALYTASFGLMFIDPVLAACMQSQHVVVALREGHCLQQARALALEASQLAREPSARTAKTAAALFERAEALAGRDPGGLAFVRACRGVSQFLLGEFAQAHALLDNAYEGVPQHRAGWHTNAWIYNVLSLTNMGEFDKVSQRLPALLKAAEERGDLFTLGALRFGAQMPMLLAQDRPGSAREHLQESVSERRRSGSSLQRWCEVCWGAEVELYTGGLDAAFDRYAKHERRLEGSLLFRIQYIRATTHFLRARCAIGALAQGRRGRRSQAQESIRCLERERTPWISVLASMASAALLLAEGDTAGAVVRLRKAITRAEDARMFAHAEASRLRLGTLLGGVEGAEMITLAERGFQLRGVKNPHRFAAMLFPDPTAPEALKGTGGLSLKRDGP